MESEQIKIEDVFRWDVQKGDVLFIKIGKSTPAEHIRRMGRMVGDQLRDKDIKIVFLRNDMEVFVVRGGKEECQNSIRH